MSALLETGKITSTSTALQLDKLARKDEARAETLLGQIAQLPEGKKVPKQVVETVLVEAGVRRGKKKKEEAAADTANSAPAPATTPQAPTPAAANPAPGGSATALGSRAGSAGLRHRFSPGTRDAGPAPGQSRQGAPGGRDSRPGAGG